MIELGPRFWEKVDKTDTCWLWTGGLNTGGYGQFHVPGGGGRKMLAHRATYYATVGAVPPGKELDHRCGVRRCCNPAHLRALTRKENQEHRRGPRKDNKSSGVLGVTWSAVAGKWRVRIQHNKVSYWGGYFDCLEEAERAAIALRNEHFTYNDMDRLAA